MARDKLTEYSATASENTVCGDVNIAENSALPSDMNNYAREIMTHLKNFSDGTDAIDALTVTGDLTVDTNTLHVDAANNRVGVGTTSPGRNISLDSGSAEGTIQITNSTSGAGLGNGFELVHYTTGETQLINRENAATAFYTNGTERLRILSGGGITFNGDTAAANALDDYEEGTWTPTVTPSGSGSISITGTSAKYTKIGNQVTIWLKFQISSVSSPSGRIGVSGAPYSATGQPYAATAHVNGFSTFSGKAGALVEASGTFNIDRYINGGISSNLANYAAASAYVFMTATYPVS